MDLDFDTPDTDEGPLDDAPLTERSAIRLERICGNHWAKSTHASECQAISEEWRRLLPNLRARALARSMSEIEYRNLLSSAWGTVVELFQALHRNAWDDELEPSKKPRGFWYHQQPDIFRTEDNTRGFDIDSSELSEVAARYLQHPEMQSNRLDWIFLDSIVLSEFEAFARDMLYTRAHTGMNLAAVFAGRSELKYYGLSFLFWTIGVILAYALPVAAVYDLAAKGHEEGAIVLLAIWALLTLWNLVTYPLRFRARRKARKLVQHLLDLYRALGENTISPMQWRKMLDAATTDGVVLDGAAFTIIDRAIARDATAFIPSQG